MPLMNRQGQQRIVPDHSVDAYKARGWQLTDAPDPPNVSDLKDVWVDYAKTQGYDPSEGLTKAELVEAYGG